MKRHSSILRLTKKIGILLGAFLFSVAQPACAEAVSIVPQIGNGAAIYDFKFGGNGRYVLALGAGIQVWDVETGRFLRSLGETHTGSITAFATAAGSNIAATAAFDKSVRIWNVATGEELMSISEGSKADALALSDDGKFLAAGGEGKIKVWDVTSRRLARVFNAEPRQLILDRESVISGDWGALRIFSLRDGIEKTIKITGTPLTGGVAFDPLSKLLAFQGPDGISLVNLESGGRVGVTINAINDTGPVSFSPDGSSVFFVRGTKEKSKIVRYDLKSRSILQEFMGERFAVNANGGFLLVGKFQDSQLDLLNLADGKRVRELKALIVPLTDAAVTSDGLAVVSRQYGPLAFWNLETGRLSRTLDIGAVRPLSIRSERNEPVLVIDHEQAPAEVKTIRLDIRTGKQLGQANEIERSKDGSLFIQPMRAVRTVFEASTGKPSKRFSVKGEVDQGAALSPDKSTLLMHGYNESSRNMTARVWNIQSGRQMHSFSLGDGANARFLRGGRLILSLPSSDNNIIQVFDLSSSDKVVKREGFARWVALDNNDRLIVTGGEDGFGWVWNIDTGATVAKLQGTTRVVSAAFSKDSRTILTVGSDGASKVWDAYSGSLKATLLSFVDGEWLTITPEGFFDASSPKAARNLTVVRGLEVYSIDQVYDAMFRPDLVREKLAGDPNGKVRDAAAKLDLTKVIASGGAPKVAITSHKDGTSISSSEVTVNADVTERGGGIGKIEWRLNGQTLGVDTRGFKRVEGAGAAPSPTPSITVSQKLAIEPGDNVVEVVAYNARGLIASVPARVTLKGTGMAAQVKPRLFVLSVGVNDYLDSRLQLKFAAPDARAIAASFEKAGSGFYEAVKVRTVLDADVTAAKLEAAFKDLSAEVKPTDVFVFFVAGHGRTLNGKYYFIPHDFRYRDQDSYAQSAVSQDQWQGWFSQVKAKKSILIYDTCESGSVTADTHVVASRGPQQVEEQAVAYEKLRRATGLTVLAASTDTQPALEGYRGHGVLSYAVMDAIERGPANASGLVEVTGLISYVDTKVPELSYQAFKLRQFPQAKFNGSNFPLVRRTAVLGNLPPAPSASATQPQANIPTKPTHVVIAPAAVRQTGASNAPAIVQLPAGSQVAIIQRQGPWILVARDGKQIGYVEEKALATLQ